MANIEAHSGPAAAPGTSIGFNFRLPPAIYILLAVALVIRLGLASLPGFGVDMGTFQAWSINLANNGPWNFYQEGLFTDYAPGYMYVLWLIGELHQILDFNRDQYEFMLKIPSIIADLAAAFLLYKMLDRQRPAVQLGATVLYLFFPAAMWVGALWGQVDSILSFFLLLSIYFIGKDKPVAGAVAYTIGFLVKPQAIAALPFLAFWIIRDHPPKLRPGQLPEIPRVLVECTVVPLIVLLVLITPFFTYEPWRLIGELYDATNVANYRVNSFWAYNFWNTGGLFEMGFRCDLASACPSDANATSWLGIPTRYWSLFMLFTALGAIIVVLRNARGTGFLALGVALSTLAFYLLLTRMHERYVFPAFLPFLLACVLLQSRMLWAGFVTTSAVHFINLYHVFGYYYIFNPAERGNWPDWLRVGWFYRWLERSDSLGVSLPLFGTLETVQLMSVIFVVAFLLMIPAAFYLADRQVRRAGVS